MVAGMVSTVQYLVANSRKLVTFGVLQLANMCPVMYFSHLYSLQSMKASCPQERLIMDVVVLKFIMLKYLKMCHFADNWSEKACRRRTQGVGRMRHLKKVFRRFR